jgi:recombination protein RecR
MLPACIEELGEKFQAFPGIGKRSSQKLALDLLEMEVEKYNEFSLALQKVRSEVVFCKNCGFFASKNSPNTLCPICLDSTRVDNQLCLVEKPTDVLTIEKSQIFRGGYHIVGKLISPLDGIFAEDTDISRLINQRINKILEKQSSLELIVFFRAGFAGETTIAYIKELLKPKIDCGKIKITKLAQGLPLYYNPDTLDQATMVQALQDRREIL